jgi:3-phenylpropionate/trans-cinnamate dioxygenase ferredoxin reductase subunit
VVLERRLPNDLPVVLKVLEPFREQLAGVAVESTYNWYWLVDGLLDHGHRARLVNTAAVPQNAVVTKEGHSDVVIVGASHAATQLAHGLRRFGWERGITVVGEEPVLPYHRPPLSKEFLKGNKSFEQILLRQESMYTKSNVELMLGRRVVSIDRERKKAIMENGDSLGYEKLALTTGARPRRLSIPGATLRGVCYVRTVADIHSMLREVKPGGHAMIIGGGYIGLEAAASLRALEMNVTVLEAAERILQRVTCPSMSTFFTRVHREEGVDIRLGVNIASIEGDQRVTGVRMHNGDVEAADLVVVGIGIEPNVSLAEKAGLEVNDGIVVNEYGQTADPNVFSAGDCASFLHPR